MVFYHFIVAFPDPSVGISLCICFGPLPALFEINSRVTEASKKKWYYKPLPNKVFQLLLTYIVTVSLYSKPPERTGDIWVGGRSCGYGGEPSGPWKLTDVVALLGTVKILPQTNRLIGSHRNTR